MKRIRLPEDRVLRRALVLLAVFAAGTGALFGLRALAPGAFYAVYVPFSRWAQWLLSWITAILPFSLAEVLVVLAVPAAPVLFLVFFFRAMLIPRGRTTRQFLRFFTVLLCTAAGLVFSFYLLWGMNYGGPSLADRIGLESRACSEDELFAAAELLMNDLNEAAEKVERTQEGVAAVPDFRTCARTVRETMSDYAGVPLAPAKPVLLSVPLSYTETTGIFCPFTGESNVNTANRTAGMHFVIAHEMAHRFGVAPEDEANFYAFIALFERGGEAERYSALFSAWQYTASALRSANADRYKQLAALRSASVKADIAAYDALWKPYAGRAAEVSQRINNGYLVAQGETDGVRSYGRMVDLLVIYYLSKNPNVR